MSLKGKPHPRRQNGQGRQKDNKYSPKTGRKLPLVRPGPLTPRGQTGEPSRKEATRTLAQAERAQQALRLKVDQSLTYAQIAERLGVSVFTVQQDLIRMLTQFTKDIEQTVPVYRAMELARTERNDRLLLPLAYGQIPKRRVRIGKGKQPQWTDVENDPTRVAAIQIAAARELRENSARRASLLGLDAPVKVAPTDPTGERPYQHLSMDELEQLVADKERRLLGDGKVIDVKASGNVASGNGHQPAKPEDT